QMTANKIDVVESACEEYSQEVLGFSNVTDSGTPTPQNDPIVFVTSPTLTLFGDSDFLLFEEADAFLGRQQVAVIIAKEMRSEEKAALIKVLKSHKRAIAWKLSDIQGINSEFCTHKILMEEDYKPVSLGQPGTLCTQKGGFTVVENEEKELIPTRLVTGWRVCIDYRKSNEATRKDHFPLPFMNQMLERLAGNEYYCFLDGFSGYFQIPIDPRDQEKTTFTCPYGTFAYRRMPKMLQRCEDTNLSLNWEKSHFMVKEGIVLGHKISKNGIEVDRAKVDVFAKLPHPTTVKGIRSFLGHA
nr:DNA-directed DNA polymerase [Tanacetum cinerariifolium]